MGEVISIFHCIVRKRAPISGANRQDLKDRISSSILNNSETDTAVSKLCTDWELLPCLLKVKTCCLLFLFIPYHLLIHSTPVFFTYSPHMPHSQLASLFCLYFMHIQQSHLRMYDFPEGIREVKP